MAQCEKRCLLKFELVLGAKFQVSIFESNKLKVSETLGIISFLNFVRKYNILTPFQCIVPTPMDKGTSHNVQIENDPSSIVTQKS